MGCKKSQNGEMKRDCGEALKVGKLKKYVHIMYMDILPSGQGGNAHVLRLQFPHRLLKWASKEHQGVLWWMVVQVT